MLDPDHNGFITYKELARAVFPGLDADLLDEQMERIDEEMKSTPPAAEAISPPLSFAATPPPARRGAPEASAAPKELAQLQAQLLAGQRQVAELGAQMQARAARRPLPAPVLAPPGHPEPPPLAPPNPPPAHPPVRRPARRRFSRRCVSSRPAVVLPALMPSEGCQPLTTTSSRSGAHELARERVSEPACAPAPTAGEAPRAPFRRGALTPPPHRVPLAPPPPFSLPPMQASCSSSDETVVVEPS